MGMIRVTRQHAIGERKARAAVERLACRPRDDLDAECHWEGSTLQFTRTGASGHIDVGGEDVKIEIKWGMPLTRLRGKTKKTVEEKTDEYLAA